MKFGLIYSRIRKDEKLILQEMRDRGHDVVKIDIRDQQYWIGEPPEMLTDLDLVIDRCLATSRSRYITQFCQSYGLNIVNSPQTAEVCADKVRCSIALQSAGVPTPKTAVSFTVESALASIERLGYPCVLKPVVGSWGRLMAKIESRNAAEAILEHKETLGNYEHKVFYLQEFVDKPDRDIRVVSLDGHPAAAMTRSSDHWLTNAALGGETASFEITDELAELVARASDAVGGGLLGVDLMETPRGYTVHEVNHSVEFTALNDATAVDVPAEIVDWLESQVEPAVEIPA